MSIFGIGRGSVGKIKRKRAKASLKQKASERKTAQEIRKLKEKTSLERAKAELYEAEAERKRARKQPKAPKRKRQPLFGRLPKKRQGRKLSRKSRIRMF